MTAAPLQKIRFPTSAQRSESFQMAEFKKILSCDNPRVAPNKECLRRTLSGPMGPHELTFAVDIERGHMFPWAGQLLLKSDATEIDAGFDFEFSWQGRVLVSKPDLRTACCYANDPIGPDRSSRNKSLNK